MLKIVNGSLEDVKKELQSLIKSKRDYVAGLKDDLKNRKKALKAYEKQHPKKGRTDEVDLEILGKKSEVQKLEEKIKQKSAERDEFSQRFSITHMLPVSVGGIVINYKLYEKMLKKLDGFQLGCEVYKGEFILNYTSKVASGNLALYDISENLNGIVGIPEAIIIAEESEPDFEELLK
ncbi:hypothetical protein BKP37_00640 [Anaerobacillus alkalilacustris]|uniref:Uncharacterized protein n=1 Tax=Anaerobacillus alkalilacustris TaxID=393763 RepID=A0A1S2LX14_9BACI|nr:hypothetical protein [Anaerobacillus alkalilacustris]OIJ17081.1 hypothetical protein BKP37_00640 [Anaerobacillus alkalilacustris]